jgi:signal transduction histidine kinase
MSETSQEEPQPHGGDDSRGAHLGFVAHEVRNPLSTALWSAELLARMPAEERGGARGEKLTAMCLRSLGRVRQLIEDHFLCERLDARGIPLHPEPTLVRALLEELLSGRRGLDLAGLELDAPAELSVAADHALLDRALESLVSIAGRGGEKVRVHARGEGGRVVIRVLGAPATEEDLGDPRKGATGDPKGRSLALPLARRIATALGGSLALEGGGYVLTVPDSPQPAAAAGPSAQP